MENNLPTENATEPSAPDVDRLIDPNETALIVVAIRDFGTFTELIARVRVASDAEIRILGEKLADTLGRMTVNSRLSLIEASLLHYLQMFAVAAQKLPPNAAKPAVDAEPSG